MHPSYYHQAHACLLVFDVTRKVTYQNLAAWYKELREYRSDIPCIVLANKIDAKIEMYAISVENIYTYFDMKMFNVFFFFFFFAFA